MRWSAVPAAQGVADLSPPIDRMIPIRAAERNETMSGLLCIVKVPDRDIDPRITTYTIGPGGIALTG